MEKKRKIESIEKIDAASAKKKRKFIQTSRKNNTVITPEWLKTWIAQKMKVVFDYDPCPADQKDSEGKYIDSLLEQAEWGQYNFVNPPYCAEPKKQNGIKGFLLKAIKESLKGKTSVFICPFSMSSYFKLVFEFSDRFIILPTPCVKFLKRDLTEYKGFFPKTLCIFRISPTVRHKTFRKLRITGPNGIEKEAILIKN